MRFVALFGCIFLLPHTSNASELVWQGTTPSGQVLQGAEMTLRSSCYPTVRRLHGKLYYHPAECAEKARNHLDIGVPLYGHPIKMPKEARSFSIRKDGWIVLK